MCVFARVRALACVCVCVCVRERERERSSFGDIEVSYYSSVAVKDNNESLLFVSVGRNISISRCHNFDSKDRRRNL